MTTPQPAALPEPELGYIKTDKSNQPAFSARQMRATLQAQPAAAGVSDAEIDRILSAPIPGGSVAAHWFLPHDTDKGLANVRDVVRAMLTSARAILTLRPQAVPMTDEQRALIIGRAADKTVDRSAAALYAICETERLYGIAAPAGGEKQA